MDRDELADKIKFLGELPDEDIMLLLETDEMGAELNG